MSPIFSQTNKAHLTNMLIGFLGLITICAIASCGKSSEHNSAGTGTVSFRIEWPADAGDNIEASQWIVKDYGSETSETLVSATPVTLSDDCQSRGIVTVAVNVTDALETFSVSEQFACDQGVGKINISAGTGRHFIVSGLGGDGTERYHGEKQDITIHAGSNDIGVIQMERNSEFCTDADGDGYYAERDCGTAIDCNDRNADIYPGAMEICGDGRDQDCDGKDTACQPVPADVDDDGDGYSENQGDCNDRNANIFPGAVEICDSLDNDCDGSVDEGNVCQTCTDADKDGYYKENGCGGTQDCNDNDLSINPGAAEICGDSVDQDCDGKDTACQPVPADVDDDGDGYSENQGDCSDRNANIFPGAVEICDSLDNDCDGSVDEGNVCQTCTDADKDGYYKENGCGGTQDCNDNDLSINPGAAEICGDSVDQDCDGKDEACLPDAADVDDDGDGYSENQGDCNDRNADIFPGAVEICDSLDNDCDGSVDEGNVCLTCTDSDGDGYYMESGCGTLIDCNDKDEDINPGAAEICGDGVDQDCDGKDEACLPDAADVDDDGDGYSENQGDCNDRNADIFPGAVEICDSLDNDCDGSVDEGNVCLTCTDADSDGYYREYGCGTQVDCNDNIPAVNPGTAEICDDGIDNDCDGLVDCDDPDCVNHSNCQSQSQGFIQFAGNGHYYKIIETKMTWTDAKAYCESIGGYLATITSQAEQDFISTSLSAEYGLWIGGTDQNTEGAWEWVTGENWSYTNWSPGEPSNSTASGEDYLVKRTKSNFDNKWNDLPNTYTFFFICEKN